jgi:hypothetical protein
MPKKYSIPGYHPLKKFRIILEDVWKYREYKKSSKST